MQDIEEFFEHLEEWLVDYSLREFVEILMLHSLIEDSEKEKIFNHKRIYEKMIL